MRGTDSAVRVNKHAHAPRRVMKNDGCDGVRVPARSQRSGTACKGTLTLDRAITFLILSRAPQTRNLRTLLREVTMSSFAVAKAPVAPVKAFKALSKAKGVKAAKAVNMVKSKEMMVWTPTDNKCALPSAASGHSA